MVIQAFPTYSFPYAGASINVYHVNKGEGLPKHVHAYDHATMCVAGSVVIRKEGKEFIADKTSDPLNLVHAEWHEVEALEDNSMFINISAYTNRDDSETGTPVA